MIYFNKILFYYQIIIITNYCHKKGDMDYSHTVLLTVRLYHFKTTVTESNEFYTITIEYPKEEVTEPPEAL